MRVHRRAQLPVLIAAALPIVVVVATAPLALRTAGAPQDEGAILLYAVRVLHGAVAHRDFLTFYGPGGPWLLAAVFHFTGPSLDAERALGLALQALIPVLLVTFLVRWDAAGAVLGAALAVVALLAFGPQASPLLEAIALLLASLMLLGANGRRASGSRLVVAGALASLSLAFRLDLILALVLSATPLLLGRRRYAGWWLAGVGIGLVPLVVHVVVASPETVFQNVFVDGTLRTAPARHLPIPPVMKPALAAFVVTAGALIVDGAASLGLVARRRRDNPSRAFIALSLLAAGLLPEMLQRDDVVHIVPVASIALGILPVALSLLGGRRVVRLLRRPAVAFPAAAAVIAVGVVFAEVTLWTDAGVPVRNQGREFVVLTKDAGQALAALSDVDRIARPGERLFVGPMDMRRTNYTDTYLYYMLPQLVPATYFLEMEPLTGNRRDSRLASDVASADVLLLTTEWDSWNEPNSSQDNGSDAPNQVVRSTFCRAAQDGHYRIYTRCGARA